MALCLPNFNFNKDNAPATYGAIFDNFGNLAHFDFVVWALLISIAPAIGGVVKMLSIIGQLGVYLPTLFSTASEFLPVVVGLYFMKKPWLLANKIFPPPTS